MKEGEEYKTSLEHTRVCMSLKLCYLASLMLLLPSKLSWTKFLSFVEEMVVFFGDILIYSSNLEEQWQHLGEVL